MKKKTTPIPLIICIVAAFVIVGIGAFLLSKGSVNNRKMDPETYFNNGKDEAAIILNGQFSEYKGLVKDEKIFLPYELFSGFMGNPFYYEPSTQKLYLTLQNVNNIWSCDDAKDVMTKDEEGNIYVEAELVKTYSDAEINLYYDVKRAVITTNWNELVSAVALEEVKIRHEASKKSHIIYEAMPDEELTIVGEDDGKWTLVMSADGFIGYVNSEKISVIGQRRTAHITNTLTAFDTISMNETIKMVWHYVDCQENNDILDYMLEGTRGINVISPTWFAVADTTGSVASLADRAYVENAHNRGIKVWALVNDYAGGDLSTGDILSNPDARAKLIRELIFECQNNNIDGINIDFEAISVDEAPAYIQFLKELSIMTHANNIFLSVDNYVPTYTGHYNRTEQAKVVDYVVIMGYDEHTASSAEPGSVASMPFVRDGIEKTLIEVPANKTVLGVPFYTRGWDIPAGAGYFETTAFSMPTAYDYISEHGISLYWDENLGQSVGVSTDSEGEHYIWMENAQSIEKKLALIKEYNLAGAAAWRLGQEEADVWRVWEMTLR